MQGPTHHNPNYSLGVVGPAFNRQHATSSPSCDFALLRGDRLSIDHLERSWASAPPLQVAAVGAVGKIRAIRYLMSF